MSGSVWNALHCVKYDFMWDSPPWKQFYVTIQNKDKQSSGCPYSLFVEDDGLTDIKPFLNQITALLVKIKTPDYEWNAMIKRLMLTVFIVLQGTIPISCCDCLTF